MANTLNDTALSCHHHWQRRIADSALAVDGEFAVAGGTVRPGSGAVILTSATPGLV